MDNTITQEKILELFLTDNFKKVIINGGNELENKLSIFEPEFKNKPNFAIIHIILIFYNKDINEVQKEFLGPTCQRDIVILNNIETNISSLNDTLIALRFNINSYEKMKTISTSKILNYFKLYEKLKSI